jgi:hypothetical protein
MERSSAFGASFCTTKRISIDPEIIDKMRFSELMCNRSIANDNHQAARDRELCFSNPQKFEAKPIYHPVAKSEISRSAMKACVESKGIAGELLIVVRM